MQNISNAYGNEATWFNIDKNGFNMKLATFPGTYAKKYFEHTLGAGVMSGMLGEEIDPSIAPIAVDNKSAMVNIRFAGYELTSDVSEGKITYVDNVPKVCPLMFASSAYNANNANCVAAYYVNASLSGDNAPWNCDLTGTLAGQTNFPLTMTSITQPIVEWDYRNVLEVICVVASNSLELTASSTKIYIYDLKTYKDNVDVHTTYPYVLCVFVNPRYYRYGGYNSYTNFSYTSLSSISNTSTNFYENFCVIPLGACEFEFGRISKYKYKYVYHNNKLITKNIYSNDSKGTASLISNGITGSITILAGYDLSYTGNLYNQSKRFIPVYGGDKFTVTYTAENRKDRLFAYYQVTSDNIEEFYEYCLTQAAYLGTFFTDNYRIAYGSSGDLDAILTSEDVFLGIIDDNGITHGTYTRGVYNKDNAQYNWDTLKNQTPYIPSKKQDDSIYDDETKLNTGRKSSVGTAFTHIYACSKGDIANIKKYLYNTVAPDSTEETLSKNFLTVNPIDCIVSCMQFPFDLTPVRGTETSIVIGNTTASVDSTAIRAYDLTDGLILLDYGSVYYYPFFGDFRDYEPYSEALFYIPYIGYIPISPADYIGNDIQLKVICDLVTGAATALIYRNGLVMETANGTMGVQIPVTGIQQADYNNSVHANGVNLAISQVNTTFSALGGLTNVVTGNIGGAIGSLGNVTSGLIQVENAKYNYDHTKVPFKLSGTASSAINFDNEQQARLILKRPRMDEGFNADIYGRTVGYACNISSKLSSFTGLTVCQDYNCSNISCTKEELDMIKQYLATGVII